MTVPNGEPKKQPGFFSIFPALAGLFYRYGKRLFSLDTLASLEKKQGASGVRTPEEDQLEMQLERNPHNVMIDPNHHYASRKAPDACEVECNGVKFKVEKDGKRGFTNGE